MLECRHRARARFEEQIKDSKDTGMAKLPFRDFEMNAVWLELVLTAGGRKRVVTRLRLGDLGASDRVTG